jgi:hypothetical protein
MCTNSGLCHSLKATSWMEIGGTNSEPNNRANARSTEHHVFRGVFDIHGSSAVCCTAASGVWLTPYRGECDKNLPRDRPLQEPNPQTSYWPVSNTVYISITFMVFTPRILL